MADTLLSSLEYTLSQPPARVGMRLRTEQELAEQLGITRWRLRTLLGQLVGQGILARRQGSGTYIRKVPGRLIPPPGPALIRPEQIFAHEIDEEHPTNTRLQSTRQQKSLQLHLVLRQTEGRSDTAQRILDYLTLEIELRGHRSALYTVDLHDEPASIERLRRSVQEFPGDGYIVGSGSARIFKEATAPHDVPAVFYAGRTIPILHEPTILMDIAEAITRGVAKLAEQGFRHIAMLGKAGGYVSHEKENRHVYNTAYDYGMRRAGLDYRRSAFASGNEAESAIGAIEATRELLSGDAPTDALLLSDDHLLPGVKLALEQEGLVPGRDIGLITTYNRGIPLTGGYHWSGIEFDLAVFARHIVGALLDRMHYAGVAPTSIGVMGSWRPGLTHLRGGACVEAGAGKAVTDSPVSS